MFKVNKKRPPEPSAARRAKRAGSAVVCAAFLVILGFFSLAFALGEKREFSDMENRELAAMPELIEDGAVNRDFYQGLERYVSDAFPFRDTFLTAHRWMNGLYTAVEPPRDGGGEGGEAVEFFSVAAEQPATVDPAVAAAGQAADAPDAAAPTAAVSDTKAQSDTVSDTKAQSDTVSGATDQSDTRTPRATPTSGLTASRPRTAAPDTTAHGGAATSPSRPARTPRSTTHPVRTAVPAAAATVAQTTQPASPTPEPGPFEANESTGLAIVGEQSFELFNFSETRTRAFAATVDALARNSGVPTYVILPPSAAELFLPEQYRSPANYQKPAFELLASVLEHAEFIDLSEEFERAKADYIYFRSDHHWTADGAYIAYTKLGEAAGFEAARKADMKSGLLEGFLGSLYKKVYMDSRSAVLDRQPDSVRYYEPLYATEVTNYPDASMTGGRKGKVLQYDRDLGENLYNVFFGGDMHLLYMHSEVANGRSIMVVRDSYGHAFLPFLANNYEHVYAVEPRYFEAFALTDFIKAHEIDELLILNHSLSVTGTYWLDWVTMLQRLS